MKILGYVLSLAGLAIIALSNQIAKLAIIANFGTKSLAYVILAAVVILAMGIVLVMSDSNSSNKNIKQASEEVPIYQGEGKKKKIIGYKRE